MNTKKKKATLITIADLGSLRNLKTDESMAILDSINRCNVITDVFCRDYRRFNYARRNKILPLGRLAPRGFVSLGRIFSGFPGNLLYPLMMDYIMSKRIESLPKYDFAICVDTRFARTLKKARAKGTVTIAYEGLNHPLHGEQVYAILQEKPYNFSAKRHLLAIRHSDFILGLSDFVKKTFVMHGFPENRVFSIPLGVDTSKFYPSEIQPEKFRVISVGNYDMRKGFQYLLKAWSEMELVNSELVIIGNALGKMKQIVQHYCRLHPNIVSVPFTKDIVSYYQKSSLFVFPSLLEGSAKAIYEAMACSLPVICTAESGSVVQDNVDGFIIPTCDVQRIKERILFLYNNHDKMIEMGRLSRLKIVNQYQWKHFTDRLYTAFINIFKQSEVASQGSKGNHS
jgi:glycosyltransferase involved in cell wall biosynthesis